MKLKLKLFILIIFLSLSFTKPAQSDPVATVFAVSFGLIIAGYLPYKLYRYLNPRPEERLARAFQAQIELKTMTDAGNLDQQALLKIMSGKYDDAYDD